MASGIGIYEYLVWIELMGMQSIMAVWDGYSLDGSSVAEEDLAPYIEQARAQVIAVYFIPHQRSTIMSANVERTPILD